jgi:hypothetical protein
VGCIGLKGMIYKSGAEAVRHFDPQRVRMSGFANGQFILTRKIACNFSYSSGHNVIMASDNFNSENKRRA